MTYFIALPLFFAWLIFSFVAAATLRVKWPEWRGRRYFFHASLWSSVGIILANALLILGLELGRKFINSENSDGFFQVFVRMTWGISAILGPLLVTAVGWSIGILVGLVVAHWRAGNATA